MTILLEEMNRNLIDFSNQLVPDKSLDIIAIRNNIESNFKKISMHYNLKNAFFDKMKVAGNNNFELGLNSFGILLDRLTILNSKLLFIDNPKITEETLKQIYGVLSCIESCKPTKSVILAKEVGERLGSNSEDPFQILLLLQKSNLAQWVNQDLLYTSDPNLASLERLRSYVIDTRYDNMTRNKAIEKLDLLFNLFVHNLH